MRFSISKSFPVLVFELELLYYENIMPETKQYA